LANIPNKLDILGVRISTTSYGDVVECCRGWITERRSGQGSSKARCIYVTSVHGIISARDDSAVRGILNTGDIATPDGMPLVWALRSFGVKQQQRVYGPTLMLHLCQDAAENGHRVFLYGGREECLLELHNRLKDRYPNLQIAGEYSPPFRPLTIEEDECVRRLILDSRADIIFVGISTPKQEQWIHSHREVFPGAIMIGVGAAFDFHAGRVKQAPGWMQRNGLEWFFRLCNEPMRLWQRYLLVTPRFLPLWAMQRFSPWMLRRGRFASE
jgi:N-acetylglucosaminyldiphosphoundecaprenol N-acetyl-beta-D-mannosaminyltransferase